MLSYIFSKLKMSYVLICLLCFFIATTGVFYTLNKHNKQEIDRLKENARIQSKINETNLKIESFNAKQIERVKHINDESLLDELDKKRGNLNEKKDCNDTSYDIVFN